MEPAAQGPTPPHPPPGASQRESVGEGLSPLTHGRSREQSGQHPRTQSLPLCRPATPTLGFLGHAEVTLYRSLSDGFASC